ncbi:hypothetical protein GOP47_0007382 [Adiantum capillus-veneris]|uniref:Uncharacterized protein n=1 Tax=Adiantum capillus-veneris TaxID=13818 RepID=A0A9D4ZJ60_ADICA|nr:hypothetical protein GOP47_0007382 [Adiantum capillus-veneris]
MAAPPTLLLLAWGSSEMSEDIIGKVEALGAVQAPSIQQQGNLLQSSPLSPCWWLVGSCIHGSYLVWGYFTIGSVVVHVLDLLSVPSNWWSIQVGWQPSHVGGNHDMAKKLRYGINK